MLGTQPVYTRFPVKGEFTNAMYGLHFPFRCYFIYCLVSGTVRADELAKTVAKKLRYLAILSVLYDMPRIYLNVNLFGSLCSFYHNVIKQITVVTTIRQGNGKSRINRGVGKR